MSYGIPGWTAPHVLVDAHGLPRYWATIWCCLFLSGLAESTAYKKLNHLDDFYLFTVGQNGIDLDDVLNRMDISALGSTLESYFVSLRNRPILNQGLDQRWQTVLKFARDIVGWKVKDESQNEVLAKFEVRINQLDSLYKQFRIQKSRTPVVLRSLPADVISALYEVLDPDSAINPFKRITVKWSAFTTTLLMLNAGLRRGEVLLLHVDAVKTGFDKKKGQQRYWINIEDKAESLTKDTRFNRPGIKTKDSIRQIPISEITADLIQTYVENYRGKPNHPYLFNAQSNTPLSHESLTAYFLKITQSLPATALKVLKDRTGKTSITPHDLRHTCAVIRLNQLLLQGDEMDEALQKMRSFFGWSRTSTMPQRYAKAVFEDRLASVWSNMFDIRVEMLRAIPRGI